MRLRGRRRNGQVEEREGVGEPAEGEMKGIVAYNEETKKKNVKEENLNKTGTRGTEYKNVGFPS